MRALSGKLVKKPSLRSKRGSMLFLVIAMCLASIPILVFCTDCACGTMMEICSQRAAQAAALAAANDLRSIVVNDPYYGYISLVDHAPTGMGTLSGDGQPQGVLGINTIFAMARLQMLIGQQLGINELIVLANRDLEQASSAATRLQDALKESLTASSQYVARDASGRPVRPLQHASEIFQRNLSSSLLQQVDVTKFQLTVGWCDQACGSGIPIPQPENLSQLSPECVWRGEYKANVDIPIGTLPYYFAAMDHETALISAEHFRSPDGNRICSAVKIESAIKQRGKSYTLAACTCAQPGTVADTPAPGIMSISFPDGYVTCIPSLRSLMSMTPLKTQYPEIYQARGGDYPFDNDSSIVPVRNDNPPSIALSFAQGFHDWLRTAHCQVRLDAVAACVELQFASLKFDDQENQTDNQIAGNNKLLATNLFYFEFLPDGRIKATRRLRDVFQHEVVSDRQQYVIANSIIDGQLYTLNLNNYAHALGTIEGGMHAGRSLPPGRFNPADRMSGFTFVAATHDSGAVSMDSSLPALTLGAPDRLLVNLPRDPYRSGGLAVNLEIDNTALSATVNDDN
jgi:hypothetical protein